MILNAAARVWLARMILQRSSLILPLRLPFLVLTATLLHLLWALRVLFVKMKDPVDEMELRVPRTMAPQLYEWVESVATERDLPMPDEIRVSADTVAHVYQRVNGRQVLVLGAVAVRALPQPVLAGIVAHELCHIDAGDTVLLRETLRRHIVMQDLEQAFAIDARVLRRDPFHRADEGR